MVAGGLIFGGVAIVTRRVRSYAAKEVTDHPDGRRTNKFLPYSKAAGSFYTAICVWH